MTAWMKLLAISFTLAIPFIVLYFYFALKRIHFPWLSRLEKLVSHKYFFVCSIFIILLLYLFSLNMNRSFDEYNYALAIRDSGSYRGPNHFLGHLITANVYKFIKSFTNHTIRITQFLNILYGILLLLVIRQCIVLVRKDQALANLGAVVLGLSFGIWKFSTSAEVYPLMLLLWAACLWQGFRILQGKDSWTQFFILSLLANLAVLTHDIASFMAIPFIVVFLTMGKSQRWILLRRYLISGLVLLLFFQGLFILHVGHKTFKSYVNQHLWYIHHPDSKPGDYDYTVKKNLLLIPRESFFSMFSGIDSSWPAYKSFGKGRTILSHVAVTTCLGIIYLLLIFHFRTTIRLNKWILPSFVLVSLNWLSLYAFCVYWRPNDEIHHWFLPFSVLLICFLFPRDNKKNTLFPLVMLIPAVFIVSSGLYHPSSQKNLTMPSGYPRWFDYIENNNQVVLADNQNLLIIKYFKPKVIITRDVELMKQALRQGKTLFVDINYFQYFSIKEYTLTPWKLNPIFSKVNLKK